MPQNNTISHKTPSCMMLPCIVYLPYPALHLCVWVTQIWKVTSIFHPQRLALPSQVASHTANFWLGPAPSREREIGKHILRKKEYNTYGWVPFFSHGDENSLRHTHSTLISHSSSNFESLHYNFNKPMQWHSAPHLPQCQDLADLSFIHQLS